MAEAKGKYKCIGDCQKEFGFGDWECFPGVKHQVASKTYYLADAPAFDPGDPDGKILKASRTTMFAVPETSSIDSSTGQMVTHKPAPIIFVMGRYDTGDPEVQFWLDKYKHTVSYERWFDAYHTPLQKQRIKDGKLHEREQELDRKEKEVNDLLAQVKKSKGA